MSLHTNLTGRLRNTSLPKSHGLMPVFEAVVNSIHSIEEKGNLGTDGKIILKINRSTQGALDFEKKTDQSIIGFTIIDNGCGFNDINFNSFETLDSDHKIDKGCRGVGRLMWLKAFSQVVVTSTFVSQTNDYKKRSFCFDVKNGVHNNQLKSIEDKTTKTNVELQGFDEPYRKIAPKSIKVIANQLLEHCLWYFVRSEQTPKIIVQDEADSLDLDELFNEYMHASAHPETIEIMEHSFELTHIKFRASAQKQHQLSLCAANRLVKEENIQGKLPGLYGKISDDSGEFTYTCYVASAYLDKNVRSERTSFNIADSLDGLFANTELSLKIIREAVLERTKVYLGDILNENIRSGKKRVEDFISTQAPRYRPIINYIDEDALIVDPDKSDKDLELHLHSKLYEVEQQLLSEGHDIMQPFSDEHIEEYQTRLQEYLQKAKDLKESDLANYVSHRKVIIDLLEKSIECLDNGKYAREDIIHQLIMPMGKDSSEVFLDSCNLWLIDERLAFHNYLGSDKTLRSMPITDNNTTKEPDLLNLRVFDNPILINEKQSFPLASITVIELKRPMRNDMKEGEYKDPIAQCLGYLDRVRDGKVKTKSGQLIPPASTIPGYCYVICDLTETMINRCKMAGLTMTADGMGYFGYNDNFKAYIEVISFNQLVRSAKERNRAFFDKLGLPTN